MGIVFLLVALPGVVFMVLSVAVFDAFTAVAACAIVLGVIGSVLRAAREWDGLGASDRQSALGGVTRVAATSSVVSGVVEVCADSACGASESRAA